MALCGAPTKGGDECRMAPVDDTGRCIGHHPDEEYRARVLSERGQEGARKRTANRAAARENVAAKLGLRSDDDQLTALETALRSLLRSKLDAAKVAGAVAQLVKVAREVLHGGLEDKAERLAKLLADNPTLAARLQVVK